MITDLIKITSGFYRKITESRTYEFEQNSRGKWNVSVYLNDDKLDEDQAFLPKESAGIELITEAEEFINKNEELIKG